MKMNKEDLINWMILCEVRGIGSSKIIKLLSIFKDIKKVFLANTPDLLRTRIFNESMIEEFNRLKKDNVSRFKYILEECEKRGINIIPFFSDEYPIKLKSISDAPLTLFTWGDLELLGTNKIAMVGSRESSEKAKKWAYENAQKIAKNEVTVVSGGAKGIDYEAHNGALSVKGKTICVLGSGLLKLYPIEHKDLFENIKRDGLLVSEHPLDHSGGRISLLRRNRIISGMSDSLILVTSSTTGGSLAQLKIAHLQKVPIFCPDFSLGLLPNDGIKEAIKNYGAKEIKNIEVALKEVKQPTIFSYR